MPNEKESFGSRWSRRKQLVAEEAAKDKKIASGEIQEDSVDSNAAEEVVDPEVLRAEKKAQLNALTDEDMPDIETLDESSDYSGFMSTGVSEGLRTMALRKLFKSKVYNVRDGLDDYDGDYTFFEKLDPTTITSDMKHMVEVEAKRALAKEEQEKAEQLAEAEYANADAEDVGSQDDDSVSEFDDALDDAETQNPELASDTTDDSLLNNDDLINDDSVVEASSTQNTNYNDEADKADNRNNEDVA
ncbi:hypothetical protein GCM10009133_14900 [Cocleimonas flava]|uniref:Uncharacterized protein DUF3306 n=1 Tax=Cocleimonas flava TaxID=634765 RepID=A0A4R1F796_9GAMM|nr:DUF3306 domain-containing protein [Cocleimonas flava]TCJ87858.1 uncharacterized protein DUF3306 [Cocleimonas flava]